MGKVQKNNRDEYWSTDPTIETIIFSKVLSRNRFRQISTAYHFVNNDEKINESGILFKIKPIIDYFIPKFVNVYTPQQQIFLDESIIPWIGRLSFKVYKSSKIIKCGILVRMVCEATTGYICNLEVYCEKDVKLYDAISKVLTPYFNLWHHVYMDNYYNSVENCERLLEHKIRCCGTIRINRSLPDCLKTAKLKRGESIFRLKKNVLLQIWRSKRDVWMISSTIHSAEVKESSNVDWVTKTNINTPPLSDMLCYGALEW